MNIVLLSLECYPFANETSLGELIYLLGKGIEKEGHNVKIFMPRYGFIDPQEHYIERLPLDFKVSFENKIISTTVFKGILPDSLASIFFIESQNYFSNLKEIYPNNLSPEENRERNKYFTRAILEVISKLKINPDIIHIFNPALANIEYQKLKNAGIIFTINDLVGSTTSEIEDMKELIQHSDFITTVSKTYLAELLSNKYISKLDDRFCAIFSGIDDELYNPETDSFIAQTYSTNYFTAGKKKCKETFLEQVGLDKDSHVPLISTVIRSKDKGAQVLLLEAINSLLDLRLELVVLGHGEKEIEEKLNALAKEHNNLKYVPSYDHATLRKTFAASDFFINLAKEDSQVSLLLTSMRYGCIPVAYLTGAVTEIIEEANGIIFKNHKREDLIEAIYLALTLHKEKEKWLKIVKNAMSYTSPTKSAIEKYLECYTSCCVSTALT